MLVQAQKLDGLLEKRGIAIDRVLNFMVPDSVLVRFSVSACIRQNLGTCMLQCPS